MPMPVSAMATMIRPALRRTPTTTPPFTV